MCNSDAVRFDFFLNVYNLCKNINIAAIMYVCFFCMYVCLFSRLGVNIVHIDNNKYK